MSETPAVENSTYFHKPCPNCGKYIPSYALVKIPQARWNTLPKYPKTICPECGANVASNMEKSPWLGVAVVLIFSPVLLEAVGVISSTKNHPSPFTALIAILAGVCMLLAFKYSRLVVKDERPISHKMAADEKLSDDVRKADKRILAIAMTGYIAMIALMFLLFPWMSGDNYFLRCQKFFGLTGSGLLVMVIFSFMIILVFGVAVYLFDRGMRILKSKQFPPPGPEVRPLTPIKKGRIALVRGTGLVLGSVLIAALSCAQIYFIFQLHGELTKIAKDGKSDSQACMRLKEH
jgi:predicted RNA-binding Zn-ribbon protein involved in translation (DUF1610 family)